MNNGKGYKLPIFPMSEVLFPGMELSLNIDEEPYKKLIQYCLTEGLNFGVVLADPEILHDDYSVGTTAIITGIEHLTNGEMKLVIVGHERFIVRQFFDGQLDFPIAFVEPFPVLGSSDHELQPLSERVRELLIRYLTHLSSIADKDLGQVKIPTDYAQVAFMAGIASQGTLYEKQHLLSCESVLTLLDNAEKILFREVEILTWVSDLFSARHMMNSNLADVFSLN
jgi:uncharacterized protein